MTHKRKKCCGELIRYVGFGMFLCDSCSVIYAVRVPAGSRAALPGLSHYLQFGEGGNSQI